MRRNGENALPLRSHGVPSHLWKELWTLNQHDVDNCDIFFKWGPWGWSSAINIWEGQDADVTTVSHKSPLIICLCHITSPGSKCIIVHAVLWARGHKSLKTLPLIIDMIDIIDLDVCLWQLGIKSCYDPDCSLTWHLQSIVSKNRIGEAGLYTTAITTYNVHVNSCLLHSSSHLNLCIISLIRSREAIQVWSLK